MRSSPPILSSALLHTPPPALDPLRPPSSHAARPSFPVFPALARSQPSFFMSRRLLHIPTHPLVAYLFRSAPLHLSRLLASSASPSSPSAPPLLRLFSPPRLPSLPPRKREPTPRRVKKCADETGTTRARMFCLDAFFDFAKKYSMRRVKKRIDRSPKILLRFFHRSSCASRKKSVIYFSRARICVGRDVCATSISRAYARRSDTSRMAMKKKAAKKTTSKKTTSKKTAAKKSPAKKPAAKKKTAAKRKR